MAHDSNGKFIGYGVGDNSPECQRVNHRLLLAYPTNSHAQRYGVTDTSLFTSGTAAALIDQCVFMNGDRASVLAAGTRGAKFPLRVDGIADLNVRKAIGAWSPPGPVCVGFSIGGAGSNMDGYPRDVVLACDRSRCYDQPIGFNTNPVPMNTGVKDGVAAFITQLERPRPEFGGRNCETIPWFGVFYSMGALVGMTVLMRILFGDLTRFRSTYMGSSAFGNPMRANGHVFPDGIPVDGEGIATTATYQIPDCHWDFVSSKGMVGGRGDDLYAKVGGADQFLESDELTLKDIRSVWRIVNTGNPLTLAEQVATLVLSPSFSKIKGAFGAAWNAAVFFIGKGLTPHTSYQWVQPRAGDPRSAWDHALWHSADMVARLPQPFALANAA
jgi:hypothetical protein